MKGVPDLFIPHANRFYHGLFIEMKTEKGRLSPEQKEVIPRLEAEGYKVAVSIPRGLLSLLMKLYFSEYRGS